MMRSIRPSLSMGDFLAVSRSSCSIPCRPAGAARLSSLLLAVALLNGPTFAHAAGPQSITPQSAAPQADIPLPRAKEAFTAYCRRLEASAVHIPFRCTWEMDWRDPGHPSISQRLSFTRASFARAFEVARALHGIPASLKLPAQGPAEQTLVEPSKPEHVWESELTIRRSASGQIERADYTWRAEGGGRGVRVIRTADSIDIESGAFGD
jgi:hypothetical protein